MLCNYCIPHYSDKVSWKGHFYPVRNENPLGEDSLPFCNLYTRNPIGLTHCAVEGLINLYPMEWMSLINGFGCLPCLITWSHPLIMTVGSEPGKQLPITMHAAREPCVHVHICNYVHTWKPVAPALLAVCVNWAAVAVNGLRGFRLHQLKCGECVRVCKCVTGRVKCSPRAAGTPDPPTTPI